jgi:SAM-dependent methyltransferase
VQFRIMTAEREEFPMNAESQATRSTHEQAEEQAEMWNGPSGRAWIEQQEALDRMFAPIADLLAGEAAGARSVLDVGCGTGATTLAVARRPGTRAVGVDISEPMVAVARTRAAREKTAARFIAADAGVFEFEAGAFDFVISRFGVMFFAEPAAAFANLRRACMPGAQLRCVVWRSPAENPFMTAAARAAAPLLPDLPSPPLEGPGQFAFADEHKVRRILQDADWRGIELRPIDIFCTFRAADLDEYVTRLGPVSRVLPELDPALRDQVVAAVRAGFAPFVHGNEGSYTAACWMMRARC